MTVVKSVKSQIKCVGCIGTAKCFVPIGSLSWNNVSIQATVNSVYSQVAFSKVILVKNDDFTCGFKGS